MSETTKAGSELSAGLGGWIPYPAFSPEPFEEVVVWIDGHRGPSWRNNHALVAYLDRDGFWWEERHPSQEPLSGVLLWARIRLPA